MGQDKGSMNYLEKPMILHTLLSLNNKVNEVLIVLNDLNRINLYKKILNQYFDENKLDKNSFFSYKLRYIEDEVKSKGPMSGIITGLKHISSDYALVLPCDSPFLDPNFIDQIFKIKEKNFCFDSIIPYQKIAIGKNKNIIEKYQKFDERIINSQTLHSIYSKSDLYSMENLLSNDVLDLKSFIIKSNSYFVPIEDNFNLKTFKNLNSKEDL
jgi:molybdopterin-guanine dinucleotide biosynthesis protein A